MEIILFLIILLLAYWFLCMSIAHGDRVRELEAAIRKHREQRADDRCWLDDLDLYAVLRDGKRADNSMPPRGIFLANCANFYDRRCQKGDWPSYQELEAKIRKLEGHEVEK